MYALHCSPYQRRANRVTRPALRPGASSRRRDSAREGPPLRPAVGVPAEPLMGPRSGDDPATHAAAYEIGRADRPERRPARSPGMRAFSLVPIRPSPGGAPNSRAVARVYSCDAQGRVKFRRRLAASSALPAILCAVPLPVTTASVSLGRPTGGHYGPACRITSRSAAGRGQAGRGCGHCAAPSWTPRRQRGRDGRSR
jgi:hypothetical protein